ncbi:MAG TPA: molybdate ABC transporter substrate-binding protein, partial [Herpetosiphonaceae bacterium]
VPATAAPTAAPAAGATPTIAPTAAPAAPAGELTVFAAASLTDAFKAMSEPFAAANGGAQVTFNFAGSDALATQINEGAPADVFASANKKQMEVVIGAGGVVSGTERTFVRNRLVVVYPKDNPAGLQSLADLAKPGVKLVLANKSVPVGGYALDFLGKASKLPEYTAAYSPTVLANVVSYEENVRAVLAKVTLGEADAGIVYSTDAATIADGSIATLEIPDPLNTIASYPIAATKNAADPALAQKFVDFVLSPEGQQILVTYGFIPTNGSATGAAPVAAPLVIEGKVAAPLTLTADAAKALPRVTATATDKGGTAQQYAGISVAALLAQVGAAPDATAVVFTGGDGYAAEVTLAKLAADPDAIIAIDENGAFRNIIPTLKPGTWVKGLAKLTVK